MPLSEEPELNDFLVEATISILELWERFTSQKLDRDNFNDLYDWLESYFEEMYSWRDSQGK